MRNRRALLIGARDYGDGFAALPAVDEDLRVLGAALQAAGYEVEVCPAEVVRDAGELDTAIRNFAAGGGPDDVRLIYFTGHGVLVDDDDCIVPAGTGQQQAMTSATQRVSTDLSKTVAASKTGLVLFVIDACRNTEHVAVVKGAGGWGDAARLARPDEHRFIRFFGCASAEVCQVLPGEPPSSLFTRALTESLTAGTESLWDLMEDVTKRCAALLGRYPLLQRQQPRLSYQELSAEKKALLARPIFVRDGSALKSVWAAFDPDKLHCLLITSESSEHSGDERVLGRLVRNALQAKNGKKIWEEFAAACHDRVLLSGRRRNLAREFSRDCVTFGVFSVTDAFASAAALDAAARAVVEADVAVFDVTGFDPGIMVLIGIRSACRRAITICTHGARWREGKPLEVPFNLQDLNIGSHTAGEAKAGADPVLDRFVRRIVTGFQQLRRHPRYLDLPAYDALRELGPEYDGSSTILPSDRVLVLCSYDEALYPNWQLIASELQDRLWKAELSPAIERVIDYGTPQLIWQSLYELIRRSAACLVDWSEYSASVFLELGVRLAVSDWGVVHMSDIRYLPGGEHQRTQKHVELMVRLFAPIPYQIEEPADAFDKATELLVKRKPDLDGDAEYNRVHRALLPVMAAVQETHLPVVAALRQRADALHHPQQERKAAPQILFHRNRAMKQDSESAALELRIAAWLYLEHRVGVAKVKGDPVMTDLFRTLGQSVSAGLYDLADEESIRLALYIDERLAELG